ncbi:MAG: hypothetical protein PHQ33_07950, partial [Bacteroidales bacterium]|nr:hypothetical protein [Bacteroidales bacterium]
MISPTPIIFVHRGYSDYMEFSLRQAVAASPDGIIILLGDESSPEIAGVRRIMSHAYENETLAEFRKHYRHMSYNPEAFERICFERWLLIAELFRREKLDAAFVVDTDVMIYADLSKLANSFDENVKCGFSEVLGNIDDSVYEPLSGHSSYWIAREIFEFEAMLSRLYV